MDQESYKPKVNLIQFLTDKERILNKPCDKIDEMSQDIDNFIEDMRATMHSFRGVAIAAPQVGKSLQIIVINAVVFNSEDDIIIINPEIEILSENKVTEIEFCLSFPMGKYVERYTEIQIKGKNRKMQDIILHADNKVKSRILQHECDHLKGITLANK
jgi:peptide deformylase